MCVCVCVCVCVNKQMTKSAKFNYITFSCSTMYKYLFVNKDVWSIFYKYDYNLISCYFPFPVIIYEIC